MCKARSEGGQRCFGHARDAFVKASAAVDRLRDRGAMIAETVAAEGQLHRAEVDLASTAKGRAFLIESAVEDRTYGPDRLLNSVEQGLVLADMHAKNAALGSQTDQERAAATARVANRAHSIAASLKRTAKVSWAGATFSGTPLGYAIAQPSFESSVATGMVLASSAAFTYSLSRRTAPADKRSKADREVYEDALDYQARPPLSLARRAVAEIEEHLTAIEDRDGPGVARIRQQVLDRAHRRNPELAASRAA